MSDTSGNYSADPASVLEREQDKGICCYCCINHLPPLVGRRGACDLDMPNYPKENKYTCKGWSKA